MKTPILGGTYQAFSKNLAFSLAINIYPEMVAGGQGTEVAAFYHTPGLDLLATVGAGPIRALYVSSNSPGKLYVVSGNTVYSVTSGYVATSVGTIGTSSGPVDIVANLNQILFVDGVGGWVYDPSLVSFTQVLPGALTVAPWKCAYQDEFAIITSNRANIAGVKSQQWYQSALNDFTSWDPLNFSSKDGAPDPIVSMVDLHREVWLFGLRTTEVWVNSGNPGFVFSRLQGVFLECGCIAPFSAVKISNTLMRQSSDEQGQGVVYQANGYNPQRISTHAIENTLSTYSTIADAIAFAYQEGGHWFYQITFPTANATWVYDMSTQLWHQRAAWDGTNFNRHQANCSAIFQGIVVVGDATNGKIYRLNRNTYTDAGTTRRWLRQWQAFPPDQIPDGTVRFDELQVFMQTGAGTQITPKLRWSDNSGAAYSATKTQTIGASNAQGYARFRRLGSTRRGDGRLRLFELSDTAAAPVTLLAAHADASPT